MDAGADPLGPARPEEGEEKPKPAESQDDGYETSNSGEAARRKPSSAEGSPAPPRSPPPAPPYDPAPLMRYAEPEPEYRAFEPPPDYQHFPFPKYGEPYRAPDLPFDMSQHAHHAHHAHAHAHAQQQYKREGDCDDPYSFVEEDPMCGLMQPQPLHVPHMHPHHHPHMMHQQALMTQPKKRGRKKKIKDENGMEIKVEPGMEGGLPPRPVKERKKHDRFNGMSEEEVSRRTLPDHLAENLDIIIIGINPGLFAAYKGHHYAGPGNHFWKCLYLSGLTREQMSADEDYKLLNFGIGFTNMVGRATKGSADLTRREIKEGSAVLLDKLQTFRPKVAVFNGKLIYEVFSGKKDFCFGKQPDPIAGTNTFMWVMPSSSARCAQLPRAADKVPFYAALKKFRDYLNGLLPHVDEAELVFPDTTGRRPQEEMEIRRLTMEPEPGDTIVLEDGTEVPLKKKRGRPKKVKLENGEVAPPAPRAPRQPRQPALADPNGDQPPKKKRGRPKKIRPEEQQFLLQQQQQQQQQQQANSMLAPGLTGMQSLPHEQGYLPPAGALGGSGGGGGDYPQPLPSPLPQAQLMYHQQMNDNATYFQPQPQQANPGMESPLDVSSLGMGRGYSSPGGGGGGGGGYAASPRGVYASPRSQGYSPSPARTPQPQFPASPAAFSAPSPPLRGAGAGGYGSPASRFAARSPLYAHSPAPYQHAQQASPGPARYAQSPHAHHPHPYSHSPAPQYRDQSSMGEVQMESQGGAPPAPPGGPAASPGGYGASPHTPYSHHSSPAPAAPPRTPSYSDSHHHLQGGSSNGSSAGSGLCAELSSDIGAAISSPPPPAADFEPPAPSPHDPTPPLTDYSKTSGGSELSPGGVGASFGAGMFDADARLQYPGSTPPSVTSHHDHYSQDGTGVSESPRLDQMHQHPMYPGNFSRSTPEAGAGAEPAFSPAAFRTHSPHQHYESGSPGDYGGAAKTKAQDVASKSLSGLESLVDQIPSIAEGPGAAAGVGGAPGAGEQPPSQPPVPPLPEYAPALYGPYGAYGGTPYSNNGYGGPFVGYGVGVGVGVGGGWVGGAAVMRPAPGYLSEWQYGYGSVPPGYHSAYNAPYYSHPPPAHHQQYLSGPPLLELHKNGEHSGGVTSVPPCPVPSVPSVGFGGFC